MGIGLGGILRKICQLGMKTGVGWIPSPGGGEMPNSEGNLHLRTGLKLAMSNEQGVSPMQLALKASFIQQTIQTISSFFLTCRGGGDLQVFSEGVLPPSVDYQPWTVMLNYRCMPCNGRGLSTNYFQLQCQAIEINQMLHAVLPCGNVQ